MIKKYTNRIWASKYKYHAAILITLAAIVTHIPFTAQVNATGTFQVSAIATGLNMPTAMEFSPDGRIFISEKIGRIRVVQNGTLLPTPFAVVSAATGSERGLMGVTFDPNFAQNHYVYAYYTRSTPTIKNRVSRFTASTTNANVMEPGSEIVILDDIPADEGHHNGGAIHFGLDGKLYIAVGDGNLTPTNAQDLSSLSGKMLRINSDGSIPADNPFFNTPGARKEVWARGLRNPFTFAVDPIGGKIHINDVGQDRWEEIDLGVAGANYGWPNCEGPQTIGQGDCTNAAFTYPLYFYNQTTQEPDAAIAGGVFYHGNQFPSEYSGNYFFADYTRNWIKRLDSTNQPLDFLSGLNTPVDVKAGPDGLLYYVSISGGTVYKIQYIANNTPPVAVISANPTTGLAPLTVNVNGSSSFDSDNDPMTYVWDFGDWTPGQSGITASHTYAADGMYEVTLTVSDGQGSSTAIQRIVVGNAPVINISTPPDGTHYNAGDTFSYSGTATDVEDGVLPNSAYSWTIVFHHGTHTHPFLGPIDGSPTGSFQVPNTGEAAPDVWYRIHLTVTDSSGLQTTTYHDILPNKSTLTLATVPPGLSVALNGQPQVGPYVFDSVVGMTQTFQATSPQVLNGHTYGFVSWSDNGAQGHAISAPSVNTTYTANYQDLGSTSAPKNTYLNFASTAKHVFIQNSTALTNGLTAFSVSAWIKPAVNGADMYIAGKGKSNAEQWLLRRVASNNRIIFGVRDNTSGSLIQATSANNIANDLAWHHVVGIYDGVNLRLYIDGSNVNTTAPALGGTVKLNTNAVCIGALATSASACSTTSDWNGSLDDVRIYNRALSASEIPSIMNIEAVGNEPGLISYWKFNEGNGQTAGNAVSGAPSGTLGTTTGVDASDPAWAGLIAGTPSILKNLLAFISKAFSVLL